MTKYQIAVVPGDGIGPEVCRAAVSVLRRCGVGDRFEFTEYAAGADCYTATGEAFPDETQEACRAADAVLHGAAGLPDVLYPDGTEAGQDFSMKIRAALDLYANIRPIKLYEGVTPPLAGRKPSDIDYVIVRENTEGLYAARAGGNLLRDEMASDTMVITRKGTARVVREAAELALQRNGAPADGKRRVTIVDKSNVLRSFAFFRRVAEEVLSDYPALEVDYALSDAVTIRMVERPDTLDVLVCENFIGDIISDLGAATVGGMGLAPSAEIGEAHGYFQGSHGTAPDIAGRGIANPVATILSAAEMLDWLGRRQQDPPLAAAAQTIRNAVGDVLRDGTATTPDLGGVGSTESFAEAISALLN